MIPSKLQESTFKSPKYKQNMHAQHLYIKMFYKDSQFIK